MHNCPTYSYAIFQHHTPGRFRRSRRSTRPFICYRHYQISSVTELISSHRAALPPRRRRGAWGRLCRPQGTVPKSEGVIQPLFICYRIYQISSEVNQKSPCRATLPQKVREDAKHRERRSLSKDFLSLRTALPPQGTVQNRSRTVRILQNRGGDGLE